MLTRLEALRVNEDKCQEEIAKELGISTSRYSRMERGDVSISIQDAILICDHFNIDNPRNVDWYPRKKE